MSLPATLLGLLDACKRQPEDDAPRLILADWLEDNAEPQRAEFIRLQIALAATEENLRDGDLRAREHELLEQYGRHWLAPLMGVGCVARFERGLVCLLSSDTGFLALAERLGDGAEAAWLETVRLDLTGESVETVFSRSVWQHVTRLAVTGAPAGVAWSGFLECSPWLERLLWLELDHTQPTAAVVRALAASDFLAHLDGLHLAPSEDVNTLVELANAPHIGPLRTLYVRNIVDGPVGVERLVSTPWFHQLTHLELERTNLGDLGVRRLAQATPAPPLRRLNLGFNQCGSAGIEELARSPLVANVRHLSLSRSECTPEALAGLLKSLQHAPIERLDLDRIKFSEAHLRVLAEAAPLPLRSVNLAVADITPEGAAILAKSPLLDSLESLDLDSNPLRDAGVASLLQSPGLRSLKALDLSDCKLEPGALSSLGESERMETLVSLNLACNGPRPGLSDGLIRLIGPGRARRLQRLSFFECSLRASDLAALTRLERLRFLDITGNDLTPADLEALFHWDGLERLLLLDLGHNPLGNEGVERLAISGRLTHLAELGLDCTNVGLDGLRALAKVLRPGQLDFLSANHNAIDDEAAHFLIESPAFRDLRALNLEGSPVSEKGREALETHFGPAVFVPDLS